MFHNNNSDQTSTLQTGSHWETFSRHYLEARGLKFIASHFWTKNGEIDLIMQDKDTLVFVEVRYRKNDWYGNAEETITTSKKKKIIFAAKCFLSRNPAFKDRPCRFDVVGITRKSSKNCVNWIEHAFDVRAF